MLRTLESLVYHKLLISGRLKLTRVLILCIVEGGRKYILSLLQRREKSSSSSVCFMTHP